MMLLVIGRASATWSMSWSWNAMPVSRRTPQPNTSIGMVSRYASAIPLNACVRPAPGTSAAQPSRPDARQTPSAMNDALCSSVTRMGLTRDDRASASYSSMVCVPGMPNANGTSSSSSARTTDSAPVGMAMLPNASAAGARPLRSEAGEQRARHVRRVAEVRELDVVHVAPRRALDVLRRHAPQLVGEVVGSVPVPAIELRAREKGCLLIVRLVVQEVLGEELRDDDVQVVGVDQAVLQLVHLLAHDREHRVRIHRGHVETARRHRALEERRFDGVREVAARPHFGEEAAAQHGRRDAQRLIVGAGGRGSVVVAQDVIRGQGSLLEYHG